MKRPKQDKTNVSITEKAPDADQLLKDPAKLPGIVRALIKREARRLEAKQNRRCAIETFQNKSARQGAQRLKSIAFDIRDRLIRARSDAAAPKKSKQTGSANKDGVAEKRTLTKSSHHPSLAHRKIVLGDHYSAANWPCFIANHRKPDRVIYYEPSSKNSGRGGGHHRR